MRDAGPAVAGKMQSATSLKKQEKIRQRTSRHGQDPWSVPRVGEEQASLQVATTDGGLLPAIARQSEQGIEPNHGSKETAEDDGIAAPMPIHATVLGKITTADGRVDYIYAPIAGFEHLFKPQDEPQDSPCSGSAAATGQPASGTHQPLRSSTKSRRSVQLDENSSKPSQHAPAVFRKAVTPKRWRAKALKRSRSVGQSTLPLRPSDDEESEADEYIIKNNKSFAFRMGDLKGLRLFLRQRLDELTMKPVRPIVTSWIKLLEPKRLGEYGPYHKLRPSEAPPDETPPWWPDEVHYNEPSHLSKSDLLALAIDLILQHRPKDDIKRRGSWIAKLRQAAEYAVETTPADMFSSSDDPVFGQEMRDRARGSVLPSLFNVAQTYEDYVFQNSLWKTDEASHVPRGKTITWSPIKRPQRQSAQNKRARKENKISQLQTSPDANGSPEVSGDETEVDEAKARIAQRTIERYYRKKNRTASTEQDDQRPAGVSPTSAVVQTPSRPAHHSRDDIDTSPSSSFDQSMTQLHLSEDTKCTSFSQVQDKTEILDQVPSGLNNAPRYTDMQTSFSNEAFQLLQSSTDFVHAAQPPLLSYGSHDYLHTDPYLGFNNAYSNQVHHSPNHGFPASTTLGSVGYPYDVFPPGTMDMNSMQTQPTTSFHGLPYGYNMNESSQQMGYSGTQVPASRG